MIAGHLGVEVLKAAKRWAFARARLRRLLDSKTAKPQQVQRAKVEYTKLSDQLETAVGRLEKTLSQAKTQSSQAVRVQASVSGGLSLANLIGTAAKAAEVALQNPQQALSAAMAASQQSQGQGSQPAAETDEEDEYIEAEVIEVKPGPQKRK